MIDVQTLLTFERHVTLPDADDHDTPTSIITPYLESDVIKFIFLGFFVYFLGDSGSASDFKSLFLRENSNFHLFVIRRKKLIENCAR